MNLLALSILSASSTTFGGRHLLYWSSEFGLSMRGRMNAVFDCSNGALVSEE